MKKAIMLFLPFWGLQLAAEAQVLSQRFRVFGVSIKASDVTGGKKFNDLGVKYYTSVISDFTDDTATFYWRLGSLRLDKSDYREGSRSLFDLSFSDREGGYPILDSIDFEYYRHWGFQVLEAKQPEIRKSVTYQKFKKCITNDKLSLASRRDSLLNWGDHELRDNLMKTRFLENRQPISDSVAKKITRKFSSDLKLDLPDIGKVTKAVNLKTLEAGQAELLYNYVADIDKNLMLRGYFISYRFDPRYVEMIYDAINSYRRADIRRMPNNRFNANLLEYIETADFAINTAIFAFKFDGGYQITSTDTNTLRTILKGKVSANQLADFSANLNAEINKNVAKRFSNTFSKLWIIGFGTDALIDRLRLKDRARPCYREYEY